MTRPWRLPEPLQRPCRNLLRRIAIGAVVALCVALSAFLFVHPASINALLRINQVLVDLEHCSAAAGHHYSMNAALDCALVRQASCAPFNRSWRVPLERFLHRHFDASKASGLRYTIAGFWKGLLEDPGKYGAETHAPVVIVGGKIYVAYPKSGDLHPWLITQLTSLERASRSVAALPDSFFLMSASDWPVLSRKGDGDLMMPAWLTLGVSVGDGYWDIGIPGGQFDKQFAKELSSSQRRVSLSWRKRRHAAVWRGTMMCPAPTWNNCSIRCPRASMRAAAFASPDVLDVRTFHYDVNPDQAKCPFINATIVANDDSAPDRVLSRAEQATCRFMIAIDGTTYTNILKYALLSGSTVLRHRSSYMEFFGAWEVHVGDRRVWHSCPTGTPLGPRANHRARVVRRRHGHAL